MKRPYYIFSAGRIRRQQNTLFFERGENDDSVPSPDDDAETEEEILVEPDFEAERDGKNRIQRRVVPVEDVESLYCFGEVTFNSKLISFLAQNKIVAHFFNYYGFYTSSLVPREYLISGEVIVNQTAHYSDRQKRLTLAVEMISAAVDNILNNLRYYNNRGRELGNVISRIEQERIAVETAIAIPELMAAEGRIRALYYPCWDHIINADFTFEKRSKRPPENVLNALLSFGNTLLYTTCLSEIYHTQLHPAVSFLHEPGARRFSLSLDLAEVFKPFIVDRMIFKLLNQSSLQEKHFDKRLNFCYLSEEGRKIVVQEYDERLKTTIKHRSLGRNVSYRRLIRLEAYKLIKHVMGIQPYKAFRLWW
jgi:CRISP-associated protein Cas1